MRPTGALPAVLRASLASPGGTCYHHCDRPIRTYRIPSALPGLWFVRACPSGVVSLTLYAEWGRRDPTSTALRTLRRWTVPPSLARPRDLRLATRHGPELGRPAERFLAARRGLTFRVVYWRVYPFQARDRSERRLFVCRQRGHRAPVFFAADPKAETTACPVCAGRSRAVRSRRRRPAPPRR